MSSNPIGTTLFNVRQPNFGYSYSPGQQLNGVRSYLPQNVDLDKLSGWQPDSESTVAKFPSNCSIVHSYSLASFHDKSETRIMENMLVFVARRLDNNGNDYGFVTIGKMNNILRDSEVIYKDWLDMNDQEALAFQGYMTDIGEDVLSFYDYLRYKNDLDGIQFLNEKYPNIASFHKLATKDVFCYQTKFGFLNRWNFMGVALSKMQATSQMSRDMSNYSAETYVLGTTVGEKARVYNYWGSLKDTQVGAKVFLYLKRRKTRNSSDNHDGPFQIYAYATKLRETIPRNLLRYVGTGPDNKEEYGHSWKLGTVSQSNARVPNESVRENALGLSCSEEKSYEACPSLPIIYIQLGI